MTLSPRLTAMCERLPTIYHGTPLTPRDALTSVCAGRAMCVSFYRPDDIDAVEQIAPRIMLDNGAFSFWQQALRAGQEWAGDRDWKPFLRMAGAASVSPRQVGDHPRHARSAKPAQRCAAERLAVRAKGRAPLAHGWADQPLATAVRAIQPGVSRMDRAEGRFAGLSRADVRGRSGARQPLARHSHDARNGGGIRLPVRQRRQHLFGAERVAL